MNLFICYGDGCGMIICIGRVIEVKEGEEFFFWWGECVVLLFFGCVVGFGCGEWIEDGEYVGLGCGIF